MFTSKDLSCVRLIVKSESLYLHTDTDPPQDHDWPIRIEWVSVIFFSPHKNRSDRKHLGVSGAGIIAIDFWVPVDCGMGSFVDWTYFQQMLSVPIRLISGDFRSLVKTFESLLCSLNKTNSILLFHLSLV